MRRSNVVALGAFAFFLVLVAGSAARADSLLERLAPDGARANVQAREGVVFVDLFADW